MATTTTYAGRPAGGAFWKRVAREPAPPPRSPNDDEDDDENESSPSRLYVRVDKHNRRVDDRVYRRSPTNKKKKRRGWRYACWLFPVMSSSRGVENLSRSPSPTPSKVIERAARLGETVSRKGSWIPKSTAWDARYRSSLRSGAGGSLPRTASSPALLTKDDENEGGDLVSEMNRAWAGGATAKSSPEPVAAAAAVPGEAEEALPPSSPPTSSGQSWKDPFTLFTSDLPPAVTRLLSDSGPASPAVLPAKTRTTFPSPVQGLVTDPTLSTATREDKRKRRAALREQKRDLLDKIRLFESKLDKTGASLPRSIRDKLNAIDANAMALTTAPAID